MWYLSPHGFNVYGNRLTTPPLVVNCSSKSFDSISGAIFAAEIILCNIKGSHLWKFHGYSRLDLAVINILSNWPACSENHQFSIDISIFSKNAMNWWTNCFLATIQKRSQVQSSTDSGWTWLWHGIKQHIDQFTQQHLPLLGHEADKGEALRIFPVHPWSPACSWFVTGDVGSCALRGWLGNGGFSAHMEWWCWWWCGQIGIIVFDISVIIPENNHPWGCL